VLRTWTRSFCFESDRSPSRSRSRNRNRSRGNKNRSIGVSRTDECWRPVRRRPRRSSTRTGTVRRIAGTRITQPSPSTAAPTSRGCHQPLLPRWRLLGDFTNLPEFGWRLLGKSNLLFVPSVALVVVFVARAFVIPGAVSGRLLYVKETRRHHYTNRRYTKVKIHSPSSRVRPSPPASALTLRARSPVPGSPP